MSDEADEYREWTWRDIVPSVGYHIYLPRKRNDNTDLRVRWHRLWVTKLERYANRHAPGVRVIGPVEDTDFVGLPTCYVMLWADVAGEDVWSLRGDLEEGGFHVSSITISYEPPMA